jgi:hypothetical protein
LPPVPGFVTGEIVRHLPGTFHVWVSLSFAAPGSAGFGGPEPGPNSATECGRPSASCQQGSPAHPRAPAPSVR